MAARSTRARFVLSAASEKCPFANKLASKNAIVETLFKDIKSLDKKWADKFVAEAIRLGAKAVMATGGFPCKGLSRAREKSRENLKNKHSTLFWEPTRILEM